MASGGVVYHDGKGLNDWEFQTHSKTMVFASKYNLKRI
jgi:hypothetical protein